METGVLYANFMVMREADFQNGRPLFIEDNHPHIEDPYNLHLRYLRFQNTIPYRREIETLLDPHLQHSPELPLDLGDSTAEIMFNFHDQDPLTYGHSESVAALACLLNEEMQLGLAPHEVYVGGILHDVWKVRLGHLLKQPTQTELTQQGKLVHDPQTDFLYWEPNPESDVPMLYDGVFFSDEQRQEMHIHPEAGGAYIAALGYPQTVIDGPYQHHGHFTFQGDPYPLINPGDLSIAGANFNVADYIAGGRARRPYKKSVPMAELMEKITWAEQNGRILPGYTRALMNLMTKYGEAAWMRYTINTPCVLENNSFPKMQAIAA